MNDTTLKTPDSVLADRVGRDWLKNYLKSFSWQIKTDRATSQSIAAVMIDGLAGAVALTIVGRHGSKDEVIEATVAKLREAIERDLGHSGF